MYAYPPPFWVLLVCNFDFLRRDDISSSHLDGNRSRENIFLLTGVSSFFA